MQFILHQACSQVLLTPLIVQFVGQGDPRQDHSIERGGGEGPFKFNAGSVLIGKLSTAHFDSAGQGGGDLGQWRLC